jgi:hypothetical protein
MSRFGWQFSSARTVRVLDVVVVGYLVVWVVLGIVIGRDIARQVELTDQVVRVGATLRTTGEGFEALSALPFVGGEIGALADRVSTAGAEVEESGRESADAIRQMSVLVAVALALLPALVLVPLYLPMRLAWRRDVVTVRSALLRDGPTPELRQVLAVRALVSLPYDRLRALEPDPWGAIERGEGGDLAVAELERLGLGEAFDSAAKGE